MKKFVGIAVSLACLLFMSCFFMPETASAATINAYHFVREGDVARELDASAILSRYLQGTGEMLSAFEREYLSKNSDLTLLYSDGVDSSAMRAELSREGDILTVTASPYTFRTVGQATFTWTPKTVNGHTMSESEGQFTYSMNISDYAEDSVEVLYSSPVTIARQDVNGILNLTYDAGQSALGSIERKQAAYAAAMESYRAQCEAYENYQAATVQYEKDVAARSAYLAAYGEWSRKNAAYQSYLAELDEYNKEKAAYDAYDYDSALKRYNDQIGAYNTYVAKLAQYEEAMQEYAQNTSSPDAQTELYQLSILKYITTPMTALKRTLANAILGDSVTQVLDAFADAKGVTGVIGVDDEAVAYADKATLALRNLIPLYMDCKTDESRYFFYISNYEALRENFCELFRCLDYLYSAPVVQSAVEQFDRTEQFQILLAQLYEISLALSDEPVPNYFKAHTYDRAKQAYYDASYTVGKNKGARRKPSAVLGSESLADRNDAEPLAGGYITLPPEPTKPVPVEAPGEAPQPMRPPVAPAPVEAPDEAPALVPEPKRPTPVEAPGEQPQEEPLTEAEKTFRQAALDGELPAARTPLERDFALELTVAVTKYFRNVPIIDSITFYTADGEVAFTVYQVVKGSYVRYEGATPTKPPRPGYDCVFSGWQDEEGNPVDLTHIDAERGDLKFYPRFRETPKIHTVVWNVGGREYYGTCAYQSHPVYDEATFGALTMSDSSTRKFKFMGWEDEAGNFYEKDAELPAMEDRDARYTARFERGAVVTWYVNGVPTREPYWCGDTPVYKGEPEKARDSKYIYTFAGWMAGGNLLKDLPQVTGDTTYTAYFSREALVDLGSSAAEVAEEDGYFVVKGVGAHDAADMGRLFALAAAENAGIEIPLSGCRLTFRPDAVYLAAEGGAETVSAMAIQTGTDCYEYRIDITGRARGLSDIAVTVIVAGVFDPQNSYLVEMSEAEERDVRFVIADNTLTFTAYAGRRYSIAPEYFVNIVPSEDITVEASRMRARVGEKIVITAGEAAYGMHLQAIFVRGADGTEYALKDGAVIMPVGGISVGAVCAWNVYTVVFRSEGKVLSTRTYVHGETIVPPEGTPVKVSDDTYSYTFEKWDREFGPATEDAEYNALFTASPLPAPAPRRPSKIATLLNIAYVAIPVFLVVLIGGIVLIVVLVKRKKKKKAARAAQNEGTMPEDDGTETSVPEASQASAHIGGAASSARGAAAPAFAPARRSDSAKSGMLAPMRGEMIAPLHAPLLIPTPEELTVLAELSPELSPELSDASEAPMSEEATNAAAIEETPQAAVEETVEEADQGGEAQETQETQEAEQHAEGDGAQQDTQQDKDE